MAALVSTIVINDHQVSLGRGISQPSWAIAGFRRKALLQEAGDNGCIGTSAAEVICTCQLKCVSPQYADILKKQVPLIRRVHLT